MREKSGTTSQVYLCDICTFYDGICSRSLRCLSPGYVLRLLVIHWNANCN